MCAQSAWEASVLGWRPQVWGAGWGRGQGQRWLCPVLHRTSPLSPSSPEPPLPSASGDKDLHSRHSPLRWLTAPSLPPRQGSGVVRGTGLREGGSELLPQRGPGTAALPAVAHRSPPRACPCPRRAALRQGTGTGTFLLGTPSAASEPLSPSLWTTAVGLHSLYIASTPVCFYMSNHPVCASQRTKNH